MNRKIGKIILFLILTLSTFVYEFNSMVPNSIVYLDGRTNSLPEFLSAENTNTKGDEMLLKIFGVIPYKKVNVDVIEDDEVILGGESIGININVDGVLVLGFSDFYGEDGAKHCPAKDCGLKERDIITKLNGQKITSASQFSALVDQFCEKPMDIEYKRDGAMFNTKITAQKSGEDDKYHLGLWARDGTSGIGTLTFINPKTKKFGALGHSVTDADTGDIIIPGSGNIYYSSITNIHKSTKGMAGELEGCFISTEIGEIDQNTDFGIFGDYYMNPDSDKTVKIASRNEIKTGKAQIYCCINQNDVKAYEVEIERVNLSSYDNKSMVIKITDQNLIDKTGGIVQGMSGAPIIQNGKLVGAITHVFVNNPTKGYAIFIENMLAK